MKILNHRVKGAAFTAANASGGEIKPELLVLHDTAGALTKGNVVSYFASKACSVSAHIVVERDGSFVQMVPFDRQANHAGKSSWKGVQNCNKRSIGIEIVNPGMMEKRGDDVCLIYRDNGKEKIVGKYPSADCREVNTPDHGKGWCLPYTPEQIDTVKDLAKAICAEYGISDVIGHFHISPKRKVDVTPLFPFDEVRAYALSASEEDSPAVRPDDDAVAGLTPTITPLSAGALSNLSFAKVNELAEQGSRIAGWIRSMKRWFWGGAAATGTTLASLDTRKGSASIVVELVREHPFAAIGITIGVTAIVVYCVVKGIERYLLTAVNEGRYTPRGGK